MRVRVLGGVGDLARDLQGIASTVQPDMRDAVRDSLRTGTSLARSSARRTAGKHGKHYPNAITSEMTGAIVGEYGPDIARPQGGMSFEFGSRNQPPHLDLARSADVAGEAFDRAVRKKIDEWLW